MQYGITATAITTTNYYKYSKLYIWFRCGLGYSKQQNKQPGKKNTGGGQLRPKHKIGTNTNRYWVDQSQA